MKNALQNWIPTKLAFQNGDLLARWLFLGNISFSEPFFEDVIQKCLKLEENKQHFHSMTSLETLHEIAEGIPHIAPTAFIFHVSRCGSTLITQLLGLDENNIVVSEPSILDEALREFAFKINYHSSFDPALQSAIRMIGKKSSVADSMEDLQGNRNEIDEQIIEQTILSIVKLLGQKRTEKEQKLFIKLDSWHIFYYEKLRKLYPNTPFIFSYRRPDEVIRSQMQSNGMHALPGLVQLELFGFEFFKIMNFSTGEFVSKILEKYFEIFISIISEDKNVLFVNYKDGIMQNMKKIEASLNLSFDENLRQKMFERSNFYSKKPQQVFKEEPLIAQIPDYQTRVFELYNMFNTNLSSSEIVVSNK